MAQRIVCAYPHSSPKSQQRIVVRLLPALAPCERCFLLNSCPTVVITTASDSLKSGMEIFFAKLRPMRVFRDSAIPAFYREIMSNPSAEHDNLLFSSFHS